VPALGTARGADGWLEREDGVLAVAALGVAVALAVACDEALAALVTSERSGDGTGMPVGVGLAVACD